MDEDVESWISKRAEPENGHEKRAIPWVYWTVLGFLARGQSSHWVLGVVSLTTGLILIFLGGRAWSLKNIAVMTILAGLCGAGACLLGNPLMSVAPSFKFWAFLGTQGTLVATQDRN